jgi:hypothetical protein
MSRGLGLLILTGVIALAFGCLYWLMSLEGTGDAPGEHDEGRERHGDSGHGTADDGPSIGPM